ncbi:MAG: hypothetical protein ACKVOK_04900 [Flavobacteriales bacterium]
MNTIQIFDRRWSLSGTILFHIAIIVPLFFIKCNSTGGGGGNNGQGLEGLMALDVAGFGDTEYGFGEDYVRATAAVFNEPTIQEEAPAITDDTAEDAPSVTTKPSSSNDKPKDNAKPIKPNETPAQKPSNGLNNALGGLKPSGSGNNSGNGQQGTQDGQIGKGGIINGGGSAGDGGGEGGGSGTGIGPGKGPGSGIGPGGDGGWNLKDRSISRFPSITGDSPGVGTVVVDIWVDSNGNVSKAIANSSDPKTTATSQALYTLAEKKAREAKFSSSDKASQKGSITFVFK